VFRQLAFKKEDIHDIACFSPIRQTEISFGIFSAPFTSQQVQPHEANQFGPRPFSEIGVDTVKTRLSTIVANPSFKTLLKPGTTFLHDVTDISPTKMGEEINRESFDDSGKRGEMLQGNLLTQICQNLFVDRSMGVLPYQKQSEHPNTLQFTETRDRENGQFSRDGSMTLSKEKRGAHKSQCCLSNGTKIGSEDNNSKLTLVLGHVDMDSEGIDESFDFPLSEKFGPYQRG